MVDQVEPLLCDLFFDYLFWRIRAGAVYLLSILNNIMLRLAIKRGILLAPFLIFFTWAEFRLSSMPNSYSQKLSLLEKTATNIEVLVLGSSHALYGINPSLFRYAGINMAQHAQNALVTKLVLDGTIVI